MLDVFNIAKPQNCDIQIFYGDGSASNTKSKSTWIKPRGVSHVYMLLIGAGGNGNGTTGGGSGAVTVFYVAAQNIPDNASVWVGTQSTYVSVIAPAGTYFIQAPAASGSTGGVASTSGAYLTASGFYQSIAGQNGTSAAGISASSTTFLGGGCANGGAATGNYGYSNNAPGAGGSRDGFFIMQPIIVGVGGTAAARGGIGCGGGAQGGSLGVGGPGFALIASW
jgi:hypothetical protein